VKLEANFVKMDHNYINENEDEQYFPVEVELEEIEKDGDGLLIDLVKRYPHLYNRTCRDYKDVVVKENTWQEIAVMMSMPGMFVHLTSVRKSRTVI
jgi:hypothetical protein